MTHFLHSDADLGKALKRLVSKDPRLKPVQETAGAFTLRRRTAGFPGLCAIVVSQQVSTASARAIWGRLEGAFDPFHHDAVRRARAPTLARLGLSAPKIRTLKAIGAAVAQGEIDLDALGDMEADDAHAALVALHGIGPWTADIYLLFCLGHADAWPAGDLALQEAARIAFNLKTRPTARQITQIAEDWRPFRGVAAHLLWAYYAAVKKKAAPQPVSVNSSASNAAVKKKRPPPQPSPVNGGGRAISARGGERKKQRGPLPDSNITNINNSKVQN